MKTEEQNDPVWKLLDHTRSVSVREDFAAATVKAVQGLEQEKFMPAAPRAEWEGDNLIEFPRAKWGRIAAALTAAAAVLVIGVKLALNNQPSVDQPPPVVITIPGSLDPLLPDDLLLSAASFGSNEEQASADETAEDSSEMAEYAAVDHYAEIVSTEEPANLSDEALLALLN